MSKIMLPVLVVLLMSTYCHAVVVQFESSSPTQQDKDVVVTCPQDGAVCSTQSGKKCCPFKDGVCCSDGEHCCPSGTSCDLTRSTCLPNNNNSSHLLSFPAIRRRHGHQQLTTYDDPSAGTTCPKGGSCPTGAACCRDLIGRYACCKYPYNVCCDDGVHCCLKGTVCDPMSKRCLSYPSAESLPMIETTSPPPVQMQNDNQQQLTVQVEDDVTGDAAPAAAETMVVASEVVGSVETAGSSEEHVNGYHCPDGTPCSAHGSCCLISHYPPRYGCCVYPHPATCCPGGRTCCPGGYRCFAGRCVH